MNRVVAIILHAVPGPAAGPLERSFAEVRARNAAAQARGFAAAGAEARIVETAPGGEPFGRRLREAGGDARGAGLIVFGSGSIPLARPTDRRAFVAAAAAEDPVPPTRVSGDATRDGEAAPVLVNNRFSADILAIPAGVDLSGLPDLRGDNGVPGWLAGRGVTVQELRRRWHLQVDLDSPIDAILVGGRGQGGRGRNSHAPDHAGRLAGLGPVRDALETLRAVARDSAREIVVVGRTSAAALRWVEGHTASRTRALVEERGLRTAPPNQRPTRSVLGLLLDRDGPEALGALLSQLGDAAVVDTRVLMAHRFGRDEAGWPPAEDRFASDLLLEDRVADPWLQALTSAAATAPIPILLGGHTLVGPGLRLALVGTPR